LLEFEIDEYKKKMKFKKEFLIVRMNIEMV